MEIPLPGLHLSVMQKGLFQMAAIGNANEVVNLLQTGQTVLELLKILLFGKAPLHFAGCAQTGKKLIERMLGIGHMLCPQVYLGTQNKFLLFLVKAVWNKGFKRIHLAGRYDIAVRGAGLLAVVLQLRMIDIAVHIGAHDYAVSLTSRGNTALDAAP